jgi:two-component system, OmpR family, sensor histidine kinase KdpD
VTRPARGGTVTLDGGAGRLMVQREGREGSERLTDPGRAPQPDDRTGAPEEIHLRDAFLLSLSHDLRAPVAAVAGASQTLRSRVDGDDVDALLDLIDEATGAIQAVISNLFDLERLRHGTIEVVRSPADVPALLRRAAEDAGVGDRVQIEVDAGVCDLDVGLTERILSNLLRNAQVHAPSGTPITLSATFDGDHVLLCVGDEGSGIPAARRELVFEPFHRGSTDQPGTGVGLYLVREFARAQGGEAWIDGRPDGGTAVHVRLPC